MPTTINGIKFFDIADLIEVLNISEITARRYIQDGKIMAVKIKGKWLVSEEHLNDFLRGADNNTIKNEEEFLQAIQYGSISLIKKAIEDNFYINFYDKEDKSTPLMVACECGNIQIAEILINAGAKVNSKDIKGWSALTRAVFTNDIDLTILLIKNGALTTVKDTNGKSVLDIAKEKNYKEIQEILEQAGA